MKNNNTVKGNVDNLFANTISYSGNGSTIQIPVSDIIRINSQKGKEGIIWIQYHFEFKRKTISFSQAISPDFEYCKVVCSLI